MSHIERTDFKGDINIGLYGFANDKVCFVSDIVDKSKLEVLNVPVENITIHGMNLLGMLVAVNSEKAIVPSGMEKEHLDKIKKYFDVLELDTDINAFGNLILLNDKGCLISPLLKNEKKKIQEFLGIPTEVSTINLLKIIGSAAVCTNKGCLVHPQIREEEINEIKKILQVETDVGTVNFGSPYVNSGLIVNKNGYVVGKHTSGPEMARIDEVFEFI